MADKLHGKILLILFGIIALSGLILFIMAFVSLFTGDKTKRKKAKAVISHIGEVEQTDDKGITHVDYIVFADYKVKEKQYSNVKIDGYIGRWKKGKKIKIHYSVADPEDATTASKGKLFFALLLIGLVAMAAGGYGIYQIIK